MFGVDDIALAVVGSALIGAGANYFAQKGANDANIGLWREQAEYNKPINQLERLREAGLNPNLIYGSGGVQNTVTSAPKVEAPHYDLDLLSSYQQVLNGEAQRELIEEQTKLTKAQENNAQLKSVGQILDNVFKNLENEYKAYELDYYKNKGTVRGASWTLGLLDRLESMASGPAKYIAGRIGDYVGSKGFELYDDKNPKNWRYPRLDVPRK